MQANLIFMVRYKHNVQSSHGHQAPEKYKHIGEKNFIEIQGPPAVQTYPCIPSAKFNKS